MSTLFNSLNSISAAKTWNDEAFEALFNDPKCFDFLKALGPDPKTWQAWYDFLERKKLDIDFKTCPSRWFGWIFWLPPRLARCIHQQLSPAQKKQFQAYKAYREAKEAAEKSARKAKELEHSEAWRKERKRLAVLENVDSTKLAFSSSYAKEDMALVNAGKKDLNDCRKIYIETPPETTDAHIEIHCIYEEESAEHKLVDLKVECTNYRPSLSQEDFAALNAGTKTEADCHLIAKAYPTPTITVDEAIKQKLIDAYNTNDWEKVKKLEAKLYTRSDAEAMKLVEKKREAVRRKFKEEMITEFLKRARQAQKARESGQKV